MSLIVAVKCLLQEHPSASVCPALPAHLSWVADLNVYRMPSVQLVSVVSIGAAEIPVQDCVAREPNAPLLATFRSATVLQDLPVIHTAVAAAELYLVSGLINALDIVFKSNLENNVS